MTVSRYAYRSYKPEAGGSPDFFAKSIATLEGVSAIWFLERRHLINSKSPRMPPDTLHRLMGLYAEEAERCIRCGFCNSVCPTTLTSIGFKPSKTSRGRLVLLQSALQSGWPDPLSKNFKELIDLCIGCTRCVDVCPAGIPIPTVMSAYRAAYIGKRGVGSLDRPERVIANFEGFVRGLSRMNGWLRHLILTKPTLYLFKRLAGFADDALLPLPEGGVLDEVFRREALKSGLRVYAFFADTYARYVRPSIAVSARYLLNQAGIDLFLPPQRDSGILYWELGMWEKVKELARLNVESLHREAVKGRRIVCTSPASTMMLREVYPRILDEEKSREVAESVVDINELIHDFVHLGRISADLSRERCVTHSTCLSQHLRLTSLIADTLETLNVNVDKVLLDCCGSGGLWGMLEKNRALSREIGERLVRKLGTSGLVVSYSETCALQISSLTGRRVEAKLPHEALYSWILQPKARTPPANISPAS